MPISTPKSTTDCTSSSARLAVLMLVTAGLLACDRFPRTNPIDPGATTDLMVFRSGEPVELDDRVGLGPYNNNNGRLETDETVKMTIPMEARRSPGTLTAIATIEALTDGPCVSSVMGQDGAMEVTLPATEGVATTEVQVGPFDLTIGSKGCDPDVALEFRLDLQIVQRDAMLPAVDFGVPLFERDRLVDLEVTIDDEAGGNGDEKPQANEELRLRVSLSNDGDSVLRSVELGLSDEGRSCVRKADIVGMPPNGRLQFGDIMPDETKASEAGELHVTVQDGCEASKDNALGLTFDARDNAGQPWSLEWSRDIEE